MTGIPGRSRRPRRAAAVLALVAVAALPGCAGTPDINGAVGLTVSAAGTPVAVAELCHGSFDHITVAGPNRGSRPNEVHADLAARHAETASAVVDLVDPGAGWRGTPLELPPDDELRIVIVDSSEHDSELTQADFTMADLRTLTPETVQYAEYDPDRGLVSVRAALADFHDIACADRG